MIHLFFILAIYFHLLNQSFAYYIIPKNAMFCHAWINLIKIGFCINCIFKYLWVSKIHFLFDLNRNFLIISYTRFKCSWINIEHSIERVVNPFSWCKDQPLWWAFKCLNFKEVYLVILIINGWHKLGHLKLIVKFLQNSDRS